MYYFKSRYRSLPGTSSSELVAYAREEFHKIQRRNPRRRPYVRSKYFRNQKIFLSVFWDHLAQKRLIDRTRRLKFYTCALDLIRYSAEAPDALMERGEVLYKFYGMDADKNKFCVQIKMNVRSGRKDFMSVYPLSD